MATATGRNGTNTGMSTAFTPINQKKHIPNSRRAGNRPKSGQTGHEKHTVEPFAASEITDIKPVPRKGSAEDYR